MISNRITILTGALLCVAVTIVQASDVLVTTGWVAENLNNPEIRIVEVSVEPGKFERGHIPGSVNIQWHSDLVDPVRRDIVSRENFEKMMDRYGIGNNTLVVLYGDNNNWFAAWGAWVFKMYGHENVRLMDGGRNKWEKENRPVGNRPATYQSSGYKINKVHENLRARLSDVLAVVEGKSDAHIVDIRSADEYTGKIIAPAGVQELAIRAGHVPGAVNVSWGRLVNQEDGTFKTLDELREIYAAEGIDGSKPVIVYCRIGERSSHTWFALSQLLGYEVKNYDGSWTEYGNSVGVPISNPSGTVWTGK
jgi:thiosulfate/3-mercaptopyruvate sulfurtransferase